MLIIICFQIKFAGNLVYHHETHDMPAPEEGRSLDRHHMHTSMQSHEKYFLVSEKKKKEKNGFAGTHYVNLIKN